VSPPFLTDVVRQICIRRAVEKQELGSIEFGLATM